MTHAEPPDSLTEGSYGPYNAEYAASLRSRLHEWCHTPYLSVPVETEDVCEVIIPAIDALAGVANPAALPALLAATLTAWQKWNNEDERPSATMMRLGFCLAELYGVDSPAALARLRGPQ